MDDVLIYRPHYKHALSAHPLYVCSVYCIHYNLLQRCSPVHYVAAWSVLAARAADESGPGARARSCGFQPRLLMNGNTWRATNLRRTICVPRRQKCIVFSIVSKSIFYTLHSRSHNCIFVCHQQQKLRRSDFLVTYSANTPGYNKVSKMVHLSKLAD